MPQSPTQDADRLQAQVSIDLPPPSTWRMPPRGYRQALAMCVLDGVSRQVVGDDAADALVAGFREVHGEAAESANTDVLRAALVSTPPSDSWTESALQPHDAQRVHAALESALDVLDSYELSATTALVDRLKSEGLEGPVGMAWRVRNDLTERMWTDTAMLAGYFDPNVDRIIASYVARAMGADPETTPPDRVIAALTEVARRLDAKILPLEFAMLEHERNR